MSIIGQPNETPRLIRLKGVKTLLRGFSLTLIAVGVLVACAVTPGNPNGLAVEAPTKVVAATVAVDYYPACGNEILTHGSTTWYPFTPAASVTLPEDPIAIARAEGLLAKPDWEGSAAPGGSPAGTIAVSRIVPLVAAPGPGDDTGILVEFDAGLAYWESDNARISTWLTTRPMEYNWVC